MAFQSGTISALVTLLSCLQAASAAQVQVIFWSDGHPRAVQRDIAEEAVPAEAALSALAAGPTEQERAAGVVSAFPPGTTVKRVEIEGDAVAVDFSLELVTDVNAAWHEAVLQQLRRTLEPLGFRSFRPTVAQAPLSDYLPPPAAIEPRASAKTDAVQPISLAAATGSALAGKKISLSPGHGLRWNGTSWNYERPEYCSPLNNEDLHNVELVAFLNTYLAQDGAIPIPYRCLSKTFGNFEAGKPWWTMSAAYWLRHLGYPCSVYAGRTGNCTLDTTTSHHNDSLYSRPYASNYDGADLYISMHTDGSSGYCVGPGCPTGTMTFYDTGSVHAEWGEASQTLANLVNTAVVDVVRSHYGDAAWVDRGTGDVGYIEIRYAERPSILMELAFHDTCDHDALYLQDNFFHSATMWGVYKGVCDYFEVTPTYDFYSAEYESDTIPSTMLPGQTYNVSITFRNRGVLWKTARQFRLGAVGDSDPLTTTTRVSFLGDIGPNQTCTFELAMTAPTSPGSYVTEWQMLRDSVTWFGEVFSKPVEVYREFARADFDEDGDVDLEDFGYLQQCFTGVGAAQDDPACQKAKLDFDDDVDVDDFVIFHACFTGPDQSADPYCGF